MSLDPHLGPAERHDLGALAAAAVDGDPEAWATLVHLLRRVVWKAVNAATNDPHIRDDAFAATWLRLAEHLPTIREPNKLPGWLTTTAINEVRYIQRREQRSEPVSPNGDGALGLGTLAALPADTDAADPLIRDEQRRVVRQAFARLQPECRELLTLVVLSEPPLSYDEVADLLGRPIGWIGPTRRRCLDRLGVLLHGGSA